MRLVATPVSVTVRAPAPTYAALTSELKGPHNASRGVDAQRERDCGSSRVAWTQAVALAYSEVGSVLRLSVLGASDVADVEEAEAGGRFERGGEGKTRGRLDGTKRGRYKAFTQVAGLKRRMLRHTQREVRVAPSLEALPCTHLAHCACNVQYLPPWFGPKATSPP